METEGSGPIGDDEGNANSESQYGLVNIQSGQESNEKVLYGDDSDSTLLMCIVYSE